MWPLWFWQLNGSTLGSGWQRKKAKVNTNTPRAYIEQSTERWMTVYPIVIRRRDCLPGQRETMWASVSGDRAWPGHYSGLPINRRPALNVCRHSYQGTPGTCESVYETRYRQLWTVWRNHIQTKLHYFDLLRICWSINPQHTAIHDLSLKHVTNVITCLFYNGRLCFWDRNIQIDLISKFTHALSFHFVQHDSDHLVQHTKRGFTRSLSGHHY